MSLKSLIDTTEGTISGSGKAFKVMAGAASIASAMGGIGSVVGICHELCTWYQEQNDRLNAELDEVPEIDVMAAWEKLHRLKQALAKAGV